MKPVYAIGFNSNTFNHIEQLLQKNYATFKCTLANLTEIVPGKIAQENPPAIFLELQNSGKETLNICRALKENKFTAHIPLVILTDLKVSNDINEKIFESEVDFFLTKPVSRWEFKALIRSILNTNKKREDTLSNFSIAHSGLNDFIHNLNGFVYRCKNDAEWTMEFVGEKIEQISGFPASDFIDNKVRTYASIIHEDDRHKVTSEVQSALEISSFFTVEYRIKTVNGGEKWVWEKGRGIFDDNGISLIEGFVEDISQLKLAEEQLDESENRFRNIVEGAPDPIFIQTENQFVYLNPAACNLFGIGWQEELVGKPVNDRIHPYYRKLNMDRYYQLYENKKVENEPVELKFLKLDGSETWVETTGEPIKYNNKAAALIFVRDINDKIGIENEVKLLSRSVEQSPAGIIITDRNGIIEYVNSTFTKITGYTVEEVLGKNPRILKSGKQDNAFYQKLWETITSGNKWRGEVVNRKKDGQLYWSDISISPVFDKNNEITHFVSVRENITEKKKMIEELVAAKEKAEEIDRLKSSFLANMSHEIRTPMNGIMGFANLLKDQKLSDDERKMYVEIIQESGQRMMNTINDLIVISKIESGTMEIKNSEFNVNKQLDYFYQFFKPETDKKGLEFKLIKTLSDEDAVILSDKEKLEAVLSNLIKNAIKYTDSGSVEVGYNLEDGNFQFYVKDTGMGIDKELHTSVFDRFVQVDTSLSRPYEGVGLGLSIAKGYINLLGGEIWLESKKGSGTLFYFTLPKTEVKKVSKVVENKQPDSKTENSTNEGDGMLKQLSVLVAEDDEVGRNYLQHLLSEKCGELVFAVNGKEAVDKYREHEKFDIVLMDIKMPVMDGYTAAIKIKEFDNDAFIIAQTAYALEGDREKALAAGCDGYLTKPINKNQLFDHLLKRNN